MTARNNGTVDVLGLAVVLGAMVWLLSSTRCQPIPDPEPPTPVVDAGQDELQCGTPAECACARLCMLECIECRIECAESIEKILVDRLTPFDTDCVSSSTTVEAVRGCPGVKCR
jgi:hypothetical protein